MRVLMVKGFKVNMAARYSDYKRFNVETLNTINKPKEVAARRLPSRMSETHHRGHRGTQVQREEASQRISGEGCECQDVANF